MGEVIQKLPFLLRLPLGVFPQQKKDEKLWISVVKVMGKNELLLNAALQHRVDFRGKVKLHTALHGKLSQSACSSDAGGDLEEERGLHVGVCMQK